MAALVAASLSGPRSFTVYPTLSSFRVPLTALGLLSLSSAAQAKGPGVTLADAVVGIDFAWNSVRPGETLPIRVFLDIAAACAAPGAQWFPSTEAGSCSTAADTCVDALEETRWREGLTLHLQADGDDFEVPVTLKGCTTSSGPSLCGELVFPPFAPHGAYPSVRAPGLAEPILWLGKGSPHLDSTEGDFDRPTLLAVAMPTGLVPPTAPGIEVTLEDDVAGVAEVTAWLEPLGSDGKPSDGKVLDAVLRCDAPGADGQTTCRGERPLRDRGWLNAIGDDWAPPASNGRWYLRSLRIRDRLGRSTYWEPPELALGGGAGLSKYALSVDYAAGTVTSRTTVWTYSPDEATTRGALAEPTVPGPSPAARDDVSVDDVEPLAASHPTASAGCTQSSISAQPTWAFLALLLAALTGLRRRSFDRTRPGCATGA
jgi:MYXO-CTERM domain-containing protein